jgi:hypothetical protein
MYIVQKHLENLKKAQLPGKAVVIYGARCTAAYLDATWQLINRENYRELIT